MANGNNMNRAPFFIGGLIAAVVIIYFLVHGGYLGHGHDVLTPPTGTPRTP